MVRRLLLILVVLLVSVSLFAEESFYQTIINASYLSDFAYNAFPVSLWADFGISGVSLMENLTTKVYARVEAGITERTLKQYPSTGDIIDVDAFSSLSYSVAFSDGSFVFEQGIMNDPKDKENEMLSLAIVLRMRWEQAFATFADIRNGNYAGIFDPSIGLFDGLDRVLVGAPELSGNKYFLSNSFSFELKFDRLKSDYMAPNGYKANASIVFAPFWLGNSLSAISSKIETDAYRFRISGEYDYTFLNKKSQSGKNLYSLYAVATASTTFLFGNSIPRYLQDKSFMGKTIVPRLFYGDIYGKIQFNGPELLGLGTYPSLYIFIQNGINAGSLINNKVSCLDTEFFGGFGAGLQMTFIGYLRAFLEYNYIYTDMYGEDIGGSWGVGCYLTVLF